MRVRNPVGGRRVSFRSETPKRRLRPFWDRTYEQTSVEGRSLRNPREVPAIAADRRRSVVSAGRMCEKASLEVRHEVES